MNRVSILMTLLAGVFATTAALGSAADVMVDPQVVDAIAAGPVRVIVELSIEERFSPEGELSPADADAQRAAIARAQAAVVASLAETDARVTRHFEAIPFLALEIGPSALAALRGMPEAVVRILPDDAIVMQ